MSISIGFCHDFKTGRTYRTDKPLDEQKSESRQQVELSKDEQIAQKNEALKNFVFFSNAKSSSVTETSIPADDNEKEVIKDENTKAQKNKALKNFVVYSNAKSSSVTVTPSVLTDEEAEALAQKFITDYEARKYTNSDANAYLESIGAENVNFRVVSNNYHHTFIIEFKLNGKNYKASRENF